MRDHDTADLLDIAGTLQELARRTGRTASYQGLWKLIVSGQVPAQRYKNRGWRIRKADLAKAGEALGLTKSAA